jgi:hypothetical protein
MSSERGTGAHGGSPAGKEFPQICLFGDEDADRT